MVHQGVYVDHTGPLTWLQRAWAAVLLAWPAALSHGSAVRAADGPGRRGHDAETIHVAVSAERRVTPAAGVEVHRVTGLEDRVLWNTSPPRMRIEEAVVDLAAEARSELDALALVADAVQSRRTTAARLLATLEDRSRGAAGASSSACCATWTTRPSGWWSSSTGGSSTTAPALGTPISSETSTRACSRTG